MTRRRTRNGIPLRTPAGGGRGQAAAAETTKCWGRRSRSLGRRGKPKVPPRGARGGRDGGGGVIEEEERRAPLRG